MAERTFPGESKGALSCHPGGLARGLSSRLALMLSAVLALLPLGTSRTVRRVEQTLRSFLHNTELSLGF